MMAFILEKKFEELAHLWIVLDDQDLAGTMSGFSLSISIPSAGQGLAKFAPARPEDDINGEDRAFPRFGTYPNLMA